MPTFSPVAATEEVALTVPDRLEAPLAASYPDVLTAHHPHHRGLPHGMPTNPHAYILEVAPACVRVRKQTTRPKSEWDQEPVPESNINPPELDLLGPQGRRFLLVLVAVFGQSQPRRHITEWSRQSRRNMVRTLATLNWHDLTAAGIPEMVTLTYPDDHRTVAPDGPTIKQHLRMFQLRWTRRFGSPPIGIWKLEFQARGAPHFHLYLARPFKIPEPIFRAWVSKAWYETVNSNDPLHLVAGTGVDRQFLSRTTDVRRLATYFSKHNSKWGSKGYQNDVPESFGMVGRFWGVWGLKPDVERVELTRRDYHQVARILRQLQRAARQGRHVKAQGGEAGLWTLTHDGPKIGVQLARWLRVASP